MYLYIPCLRMGEEGEDGDEGWQRVTHLQVSAATDRLGVSSRVSTSRVRDGRAAAGRACWVLQQLGDWGPRGRRVGKRLRWRTHKHTHKTVNTKTLVIKEEWKERAATQTPCAEQKSKITGLSLNTKLHFFFFCHLLNLSECWRNHNT